MFDFCLFRGAWRGPVVTAAAAVARKGSRSTAAVARTRALAVAPNARYVCC